MFPRLTHYSDQPLGVIRSVPQRPEPRSKPLGLWVSVDRVGDDREQGWRHWCESEGYGLDSLAVCHDVALHAGANILWLRSPSDIDAFTREHSDGQYSGLFVDWRRVATKYQGILIAPYCWSRRRDDRTGWYYGWDCASGCIWDASAIAAVRLAYANATAGAAA